MNTLPPIPPKTRWELEHPAPPGGRHQQMLRIALPLASIGYTNGLICSTLEPLYGSGMPYREIESVANWAVKKSNSSHSHSQLPTRDSSPRFTPTTLPTRDPESEVTRLLKGFTIEEADLLDHSPIQPSDNWREDSLLLLSTLFHPGDRVNIVTKVSLEGGKPRPAGKGVTLFRDEWITQIQRNGVIEEAGGAWIRMNPVSGNGITDTDVTRFCFALLECDGISIDRQMAFLSRLPLPIAAIITSGGRSIHGWLKIDAPDVGSYCATVSTTFSHLGRFGVDPANRNPSRLARLPGAYRKTGGSGDSRQRLLYLNPAASACEPIFP